ncbi:MAG TPA: LysR family transcriptional regulator [Dehalococcoidia bacterium]|nr:LysR family transcriptional regulator [Dehalococcoidia bacterium]
MNLCQLEYFATVAEVGSFRRAAARLYVSQAALSQQIKQLEHELGVPLLERSKPQIRLTPPGQVFLDRVKRIQTEIDAARAEMSGFAGVQHGRLTVGTTTATTGEFQVPSLIAAFAKRHSQVELMVRQQTSSDLFKLIAEGAVDVGLVIVQAQDARIPPDIRVEPLYTFGLGVVISSEHRLAGRERIGLRELEGERLILSSSGSAPRAAIDRALKDADFAPSLAPFETTDPAMMLALVAEGLGAGFAHSGTVKSAFPRLKVLEIADADLTCTAALAWAERGPRTAAIAAFVDLAREWTRDYP